VISARRKYMTNLIKAVRDHALANYNRDGWDYLVECWEDEDIAEAIQGASTEAQAIAKARKAVRILDEVRSEVRSAGEW
jgi:hypothetical protein